LIARRGSAASPSGVSWLKPGLSAWEPHRQEWRCVRGGTHGSVEGTPVASFGPAVWPVCGPPPSSAGRSIDGPRGTVEGPGLGLASVMFVDVHLVGSRHRPVGVGTRSVVGGGRAAKARSNPDVADPIAGVTRSARGRSRSERPWPWPEHIGAAMPNAFGRPMAWGAWQGGCGTGPAAQTPRGVAP